MSPLDTSVLRASRRARRLWRLLGERESYLVGGYIRDQLIGRPSADLDLVIAGTTDDAAIPAHRIAEDLGARAHLLGRPPRSIWRIDNDRLKVELWPLGTLTLAEDAMRRDFSCNALLWKLPDGPLIDLVNGVDDLRQRRLRAIRRHNLASDPVRLLRGPRFAASLPGFELEATTRSWIAELAPRLRTAPRERVGAELLALLRAPQASLGLSLMDELELVDPASPVVATVDKGWFAGAVEAATSLADLSRHPLPAALRAAGDGARLAWLMRLWRVSEAKLLTAYGWPRRDLHAACRAAALVDHGLCRAEESAVSRRLLIHESSEALPALVALGAACSADDPAALAAWQRSWRMWRRAGPSLIQPKPLLDARQLMQLLDLTGGPQLGDAIRALVDAQLRGKVRTASGAARWLRRWWRDRESSRR